MELRHFRFTPTLLDNPKQARYTSVVDTAVVNTGGSRSPSRLPQQQECRAPLGTATGGNGYSLYVQVVAVWGVVPVSPSVLVFILQSHTGATEEDLPLATVLPVTTAPAIAS